MARRIITDSQVRGNTSLVATAARAALAHKLVWADHRILAPLQPILDSLPSEPSAEIAKISPDGANPFLIHASDGFSIEKLMEALMASGQTIERPVMQTALHIRCDPAFKTTVDALPGHDSRDSGTVTPLAQAFPFA